MLKKIKLANKRFYNKWFYKVSLQVKGGSALRIYSLEQVIANKNINANVVNIAKFLSKLPEESYAHRIETNIFDVYFNDRKNFDSLIKKFGDIVRQAYAPNEEALLLLDSSHKIMAKKYPHDRYQYKVYLQPHKIQDVNEKRKYLGWLDTQGEKVHISTKVKDWFEKTSWNWDRRYMYVENEAMLLMLKLKKPEALGTIYTFVLSDK